ncbi:hypothetical protein [Sporosalibacterium faouarense]|nr:hypothetical protein [Sporosalibacterium faouarense]
MFKIVILILELIASNKLLREAIATASSACDKLIFDIKNHPFIKKMENLD